MDYEVKGDFVPIQSLDIAAETQIPFDLYVNLPLNQKYVLYRRKGSQVETAKLDSFTANKVTNFFVHKTEYAEFVKYVAYRIRDLIGAQDQDGRQIVMAAAKSVLSSTFNQEDPAVTSALLGNLNNITEKIIEGVLDNSTYYDKKIFNRLADLAAKGTNFQKHPVNVTSLAVLITFGIGYSTKRIIADMAMAALLHDIGLAKVPVHIIPYSHQVEHVGMKEREELYNHPQYAIDILNQRGIKLSVMSETIILQHHEEFNGFGYPKGLRGYQINEMAQILHVADELDHLVSGFTSKGSLRILVNEYLDRLQNERVIEPTLFSRIKKILI